MTTHHRNIFVRIIRWPFTWIMDRNSDLSTSKIMAFGIYAAYLIDKKIPPIICAMLITASFGYSMWKDFKDNYKWTTAATEAFTLGHTTTDSNTNSTTTNHQINETIQRTITERRDHDQGFEAAP